MIINYGGVLLILLLYVLDIYFSLEICIYFLIDYIYYIYIYILLCGGIEPSIPKYLFKSYFCNKSQYCFGRSAFFLISFFSLHMLNRKKNNDRHHFLTFITACLFSIHFGKLIYERPRIGSYLSVAILIPLNRANTKPLSFFENSSISLI